MNQQIILERIVAAFSQEVKDGVGGVHGTYLRRVCSEEEFEQAENYIIDDFLDGIVPAWREYLRILPIPKEQRHTKYAEFALAYYTIKLAGIKKISNKRGG